MKMCQKVGIMMSVMICFGMTPRAVFGQSVNHVTKVVTVGENALLQENGNRTTPPMLVIELKDTLHEGERFYLNLQNAKWLQAIEVMPLESAILETKVMNETELEVKLSKGIIEKGQIIKVPMAVALTKGEASVSIDSNNTALTNEKLVFANTSSEKGVITLNHVPQVLEEGEIGEILIEEAYTEQFKNAIATGQNSTITMTLEQAGYEWDLDPGEAVLEGLKHFEGIQLGKEAFEKISSHQLKVILPEALKDKAGSGKGGFKIKGLAVKRQNDHILKDKVTVRFEGDMIAHTSEQVIEMVDYKVKLEPNSQAKHFSGSQTKVQFKLEENIKGALLKDRVLDFTLTGGATIPLNDEGKVVATVNGQVYTYPPIEENGKCIGFEISNLTLPELEKALSYTFEIDVKVPLEAQPQVEVVAEGRGLPEVKRAQVIEVIPRIKVEIEPFAIKVAQKNQVGGSVTLNEGAAGAFIEGESIHLKMNDEGLTLSGAPLVEVVSGDVVLGEAELVADGVKIPIVRRSTVPAQIVVKHFEVSTTGVVADGYYDLEVTGPGITVFGDEAIRQSEFMMVNVMPKNLKKITFKLGEEAYAVNGKYYHLDVPAYLEKGRVMVPLKDVTKALGIPNEKVKWHKETQKLTIYSQHVIELEIGSTIMRVDGEKIYMPVATQLIDGETMVPMSEIAKALEVDVSWDEKLETATFVSKL